MELPAQELVEKTVMMRGKRTKRQRPPTADHSPTTSYSTNHDEDDEEEEEEDLANCLILLAQGGGGSGGATKIAPAKARFYVYECKTCDKTFQSFQALGGHRASHKRPKNSTPAAEENIPVAIPIISPSLPLQQLMTTSNNKIHECSICGSEFSSGQALGGHMRRHRANTGEIKKVRNVLHLDLNLPAPEDHDFQFTFSAPKLVNCHY